MVRNSRIRALDAGPDGALHSLYLRDGSVVDLPPGFGAGAGAGLRKGARVEVSGQRVAAGGQPVILAESVSLNGRVLHAPPPPPPPPAHTAPPPLQPRDARLPPPPPPPPAGMGRIPLAPPPPSPAGVAPGGPAGVPAPAAVGAPDTHR